MTVVWRVTSLSDSYLKRFFFSPLFLFFFSGFSGFPKNRYWSSSQDFQVSQKSILESIFIVGFGQNAPALTFFVSLCTLHYLKASLSACGSLIFLRALYLSHSSIIFSLNPIDTCVANTAGCFCCFEPFVFHW